MNILWLSHFAPYPPKGGSFQRSFNMLKQLSKTADITLLSLATYSGVTTFYPSYNEGLQDIQHELDQICSKVVLIPHGQLSRKKNRILNVTKSLIQNAPYDVLCLESDNMKKALVDLLQSTKYDAIHVDTVGLWPYISQSELPKVLNHHNIESKMLSRRAENSNWPLKTYLSLQSKKLFSLEQSACEKAFKNVTCSELDSGELESRGLDNVVTIPNGVDLTYFSRKNPYNADIALNLIFAGGLEWYPNRDAMIFFAESIWPLISQNEPRIEMNVVGSGSISLLTGLAENDQNFKVRGFVPDVRPYLEEASIYVCPIRDGGGTKLKVLDALAMGVPLIAHPIACEGIDVTNGENVLFAESAQEFAEGISFLAKNKQLRIAMSKSGRRLIEDTYCYEKIGQRTSELYRNL